MKNTTITFNDTAIRIDADGRLCLNDLHRASGMADAMNPAKWLRSWAIRDRLASLDFELGPNDIPLLKTRKNGIFALPDLWVGYVLWLNHSFGCKFLDLYANLSIADAFLAQKLSQHDPYYFRTLPETTPTTIDKTPIALSAHTVIHGHQARPLFTTIAPY